MAWQLEWRGGPEDEGRAAVGAVTTSATSSPYPEAATAVTATSSTQAFAHLSARAPPSLPSLPLSPAAGSGSCSSSDGLRGALPPSAPMPGAPAAWEQRLCLHHLCLSTRPPPRHGLHPRANAHGHNMSVSDQRFLALCVLGTSSTHIAASMHPAPGSGFGSRSRQDHGTSREDPGGSSTTACAYLLASSSDATLRCYSLDLGTLRWTTLSALSYHTAPVLSLARLHLRIPPGYAHRPNPQPTVASCPAASASASSAVASASSAVAWLAASGATDGSVALFLVTPMPMRSEQQQQQEVRVTRLLEQGRQRHGAAQWEWPSELLPLATWPGVHQSGVNALAAAWLEQGQGQGQGQERGLAKEMGVLVLVTGGDDQLLQVAQLQLLWRPAGADAVGVDRDRGGHGSVRTATTAPAMWQDEAGVRGGGAMLCALDEAGVGGYGSGLCVRELSRSSVANAHGSAVKGVALAWPWLFSVGLDQRLRCWRLHGGERLEGRGQGLGCDSPGWQQPQRQQPQQRQQQQQPQQQPGPAEAAAAASFAGRAFLADPSACPCPPPPPWVSCVQGPAAAATAPWGPLPRSRLRVEQVCSVVLEVLEPNSVDVCPAGVAAGGSASLYHVAVAGRGTQLLEFCATVAGELHYVV